MHTNTRRCAIRSVLCGAIIALIVASPFSTADAKWVVKNTPRLPVGVYFHGMQGSVVLAIILDKSGRVIDTRVLRSSGHPALDELAREAATSWRLHPDSLVSTDFTQGRVELVDFRNPHPPKAILPHAQPHWTQLRG